jgi:adenylate cyclase
MADVRGYTALTERLSPTEITGVVNRFYGATSRALLSVEALLGQIEGDLVMALFVPGLSGSEYPRKAVLGAERLIAAVDWLDVGVGIATGEEFVGNVGGGGFKDFTALGDVTNVAARLTALAGPGQILIDRPTFEGVADRYPGAQRRDLDLKGKSTPVEVFTLVHGRPARGTPGGGRG